MAHFIFSFCKLLVSNSFLGACIRLFSEHSSYFVLASDNVSFRLSCVKVMMFGKYL